MTLHQYLVYAAVTSPILLIIGFLIMTFKSWLDRLTFRSNTAYVAAMQAVMFEDLFGEKDADFDEHVASTPGIRDLN